MHIKSGRFENFIHSCRREDRESLDTNRERLVDLMVGKEGNSSLIASTFLSEVSSLTKDIGGREFGGQGREVEKLFK